MAMSFKCSVFGHAFGDAEIERNREEDGSEVVTTIRETQTCKRCGEERIVSENKEVTTLETAADIVADDLEEEADDLEEEPAGSTEPAQSTEPAEEPPETQHDAEILDAETGTPTAADPDPSTAQDSIQDPVENGAPTVTEQQNAGEGVFPEAEDGAETDPETDDGVILDEEEEETDDRSPGEWPEEPGDDEDDWQPETEIDPTPEEPTVEPTGSAVTVPDGEFYCPECEFTTPVEESSLRAGDFCPECHRGSLEHVSE
jgi:ssDNA-binding Zn-finger/Zn-ribbon topoisomerase 1